MPGIAMIRVSLALLVGSLAGCAATPSYMGPDNLPTTETGARHQYRGFSVAPPQSSGWTVRVSEQSPPHAIFRFQFPSETRTAFAAVDLGVLRQTVGSHEEFAEMARSDDLQDHARLEIVEYRQELATIQGQWCIRFSARALDRSAPNSPSAALHLIVNGWRCRHPAFPDGMITAIYSERGLPDEVDPSLPKAGREFLDAIVIELAPGEPAG